MNTIHILQEASEKLLSSAAGGASFDAAIWSAVEESGFDRLLMSESEGGLGNAFPEAVAFCRPLGRYSAAVPIIETMVANWALEKAALEVPSGAKALVITDAISLDTAGTELIVHEAVQIPWAGMSGGAVFFIPAWGGNMVVAHANIPYEGNGQTIAGHPFVRLKPGRLSGLRCLGRSADTRSGLALAALLKASAMAGAMEEVLDLSLEYANTRKQFGKAIGSFQAIQHMMVGIASEAAAVSVAVDYGAAIFGDNPLWAAALAKGRASEAAGRVAATAHQVHGAIGYTREYALHRQTRSLWEWREEYGNEHFWYEKVGVAAASNPAVLWSCLSSAGLSVE